MTNLPHLNKTVILGKNGQLARAFAALLPGRGEVIGREAADLKDIPAVIKALEARNPSAVINTAAYTAVDKAESEPTIAHAINAEAPAAIARWCAAHGVPFMHFSTDYVFDGSGENPRDETTASNPLNIYGASKLAGEEGVRAAGGKHLIFRTSWVYDAAGANFVNTMLRLGAERDELRVVADQTGAPTYAPHLAHASLQALENALALPEFPSGIYHLCGAGETTWHGFAESIFQSARAHGQVLAVQRVVPIASSEYPTPAKRPLNSRLNCTKAKNILGVQMPAWQEGLAACMNQKYAGS